MLVVVAGPATGRRAALPEHGHLVIGRDTKCTLPLPEDDAVSMRHCAIEVLPDGGGFVVVTDLMTRNTRINDVVIVQQVMRPGDRLQVGNSVIELQNRRPVPAAGSTSGRRPRISTRAMRLGTTVTQTVATDDDVMVAAAAVSQLGTDAGFSDPHAADLADVVREVAGNAIKHAGKGELTARRTRRGVRIEVFDTGPGLPMELLRAFQLAANASDSGNVAGVQRGDESTGLWRVRHVTDQLSIISLPGNTQVVVEMFADRAPDAR
ncbi:MAG: ATP-binding protein [Planctomycetota bacterium]